MDDNATGGPTAPDRPLADGPTTVAALIDETLVRAGERRGGGFTVVPKGARGYIERYEVRCTDAGDAGAVQRYYRHLSGAGWFASAPAACAEALTVEVIGETLLERAPAWLCERWSALGAAVGAGVRERV